MKFYAPKYKQLDLGLLRSSLDDLDKTNRWVALGDLLPCHPSQVLRRCHKWRQTVTLVKAKVRKVDALYIGSFPIGSMLRQVDCNR